MNSNQEQKNSEKATLIIDPNAHTDIIRDIACDSESQWAITGSDDKTIRVWSLVDNSLSQTIRIKSEFGNIGKILAVAITPDSQIIAAGGWTRYSQSDPQENIYLYKRNNGELFKVIQGLKGGTVRQLAFSNDGEYLFAGGEFGLCTFSSQIEWKESGRDMESYICDGLDIASNNYLVTSSRDGYIRLYQSPFAKKLVPHKAQVGDEYEEDKPEGIKFFHSDEVDLIAIGFSNRVMVEIRDGKTLELIRNHPVYYSLDGIDSMKDLAIERTRLLSYGSLQTVAWSLDGTLIYGAGKSEADPLPIYGWSEDSKEPYWISLAFGGYQVTKIITLSNGDLLVAGSRGKIGRIKFKGAQNMWEYSPISENPLCELPYMSSAINIKKHKKTFILHESIKTSSTGEIIDFFVGKNEDNAESVRFDINSRKLIVNPEKDGKTRGMKMQAVDDNLRDAKIGKLRIIGWDQVNIPFWPSVNGGMLDGSSLSPLTVNNNVVSFENKDLTICFAAHPGKNNFVVGCEYSLRCINKDGIQLWKMDTPSVLGLNTAKNGELIIGVFADNTIRWYRNGDGQHLLSLLLLNNFEDWVAWTPEGFYGGSAKAYGFLKWHINKDWNKSPDSFPIHNIAGSFRPMILNLILQELDLPRALGFAIIKENEHKIKLRTYKKLPEKKQLYLVSIGISEYEGGLKLKYAEKDANDLATKILDTQNGCLYSQVKPIVLSNQEATQKNIWAALERFNNIIEYSKKKNDLFIFFFSGHGINLKNEYYLIPYDIDNSGLAAIKSTGLSIRDLRSTLENIASKNCQILVLLDACYSGGFSSTHHISKILESENIAVIVSSHANEPSFENEQLEHGIFTKGLLDSFNADNGADLDRNGLITITELSKFINDTVTAFSKEEQTVAMEIRHEFPVFTTSLW